MISTIRLKRPELFVLPAVSDNSSSTNFEPIGDEPPMGFFEGTTLARAHIVTHAQVRTDMHVPQRKSIPSYIRLCMVFVKYVNCCQPKFL